MTLISGLITAITAIRAQCAKIVSDRYEGIWLDDKRSGLGVMTFSDGEKYDGD